ncbi:MAG TPA: VanZ family protein [Anaerolineales bacterium]|nr:VanZ family protein [Anaerolineales bacterium]
MRVIPAVLTMLAIFLFSAGPSMDMQDRLLERIVNKGGHIIGYGILALSYWRIFGFRGNKFWLAWFLAVLYAMTDEYHQSFVPGRYSSLFDVLVYDTLGALIALWLAYLYLKTKQPAWV